MISVFFHFLPKQTSQSCTDMDEPQIAVYKLLEKYFFNTIVLQLKAYVMLQLSYLTGATKVRSRFDFDIQIHFIQLILYDP